ncbi:hypothetical protein NDU88_001189 [Pleurodeles waltl]|uniref:Uncharacterized protein n=1 Tax=Pleurodeles waltl TaxID=8319 RepID=A0AAV7KS87_PLEWA|nr:hypothetical protein NDU88_001189 [Pleurodeles waltl]
MPNSSIFFIYLATMFGWLAGWLLRPFPGPHQKILDNACEIFQFIDKTIQEHRQTLDAENPKAYIDAYLLEMDKVRGQDP